MSSRYDERLRHAVHEGNTRLGEVFGATNATYSEIQRQRTQVVDAMHGMAGSLWESRAAMERNARATSALHDATTSGFEELGQTMWSGIDWIGRGQQDIRKGVDGVRHAVEDLDSSLGTLASQGDRRDELLRESNRSSAAQTASLKSGNADRRAQLHAFNEHAQRQASQLAGLAGRMDAAHALGSDQLHVLNRQAGLQGDTIDAIHGASDRAARNASVQYEVSERIAGHSAATARATAATERAVLQTSRTTHAHLGRILDQLVAEQGELVNIAQLTERFGQMMWEAMRVQTVRMGLGLSRVEGRMHDNTLAIQNSSRAIAHAIAGLHNSLRLQTRLVEDRLKDLIQLSEDRLPREAQHHLRQAQRLMTQTSTNFGLNAAKSAIIRAFETCPAEPAIMEALGDIHVRLRELAEAIDPYVTASQLLAEEDPLHAAELRQKAANLALELDQIDVAATHLSSAAALNPDDESLQWTTLKLQLKKGDRSAVQTCLGALMKRRPDALLDLHTHVSSAKIRFELYQWAYENIRIRNNQVLVHLYFVFLNDHPDQSESILTALIQYSPQVLLDQKMLKDAPDGIQGKLIGVIEESMGLASTDMSYAYAVIAHKIDAPIELVRLVLIKAMESDPAPAIRSRITGAEMSPTWILNTLSILANLRPDLTFLNEYHTN